MRVHLAGHLDIFLIRHATPRDRDTLAALYLTCRRQTFTWVDPAHYALHDFDEDTQDELLLVCERDERTVGFLGLWADELFLHHLFVLADHQGHGAGRGLLRAAQSYVSAPLRLKCAVRNERALSFYERLGGVIEKTSTSSPASAHPEGAHHTIRLPAPR